MGNAMRYMGLVLLVAAVGALFSASAEAAYDSEEGILVGRIAHVEGKLLRYIEEENDWVVTVRDSPFGLEDALYAGDDAKAEFIMPNKTWLRVGENTQVQLIALNPETTTVDVASGLARLYNKSDDTVIKVTTPFGYVVAPGDTVFDLYVGDESLEVIAVRGTVDFVHDGSNARYEIEDGSFSIIASKDETAEGNGNVDSEWDDWNGERDILWAKRLRSRSYSEDYLPEPIREESYALDESGEWESVYYEGEYRHMWRPTRVDRGWRPFTVGRWSVYYGDQCWVPDEPFGYVTHHYGSWIYIESSDYWYWAPPVHRIVVGGPVFSISFGWYPGRVGWIHSGPSIGWVPLAPHETYYGYRPWGHRTVIYNQTTVFNINIVNYRYLDEAVVIDRDRFYRGSSYTPYVQRNVSRDSLINDYRPTTVINNTVINNYNTDTRRFAYNDVEVSRKPHTTVIDRITDNRKMTRDSSRINRERIEKDLTRVKIAAEPPAGMTLRAPTLANKLVDADKIDKPLSTLSLEKKEVKGKDRERRVVDDKDRRRGKIQDESGQVRKRDDSQDGKQRIRSPRDAQKREVEQGAADTSPQSGEKVRRPQERTKLDQVDATNKQGEKKQLRSPRDTRNLEADQLGRQQEATQESKGPKLRPRQKEEEKGQHLKEQEAQQLQADEPQKRPAQPQSPRLKKREQQEELQKEQTPALTGDKESRQRSQKEVDQVRGADKQDDTQRVQSPRAPREKGKEQLGRQQDEVRQQKEDQSRQEQELQQRKQKEDQGRQEQELQQRKQKEDQSRQEQELQQRKQKEDQGRQQQELQQRKQKEDQGRQQQELQQRKQKEEQGRQQQELQQRKQKEEQSRQAQELQQRKQQEEQGRQQQELQRRKQQEEQGRQQQELQRRKQQEEQGRQQQELQRRKQQEEQGRQQQELQQRKQQEEQGRKQQELQRRQQEENQVRQKQENQRQRQEEVQKSQEQQQPAQPPKKKKTKEEEEAEAAAAAAAKGKPR